MRPANDLRERIAHAIVFTEASLRALKDALRQVDGQDREMATDAPPVTSGVLPAAHGSRWTIGITTTGHVALMIDRDDERTWKAAIETVLSMDSDDELSATEVVAAVSRIRGPL
jgi:hypothetical protein